MDNCNHSDIFDEEFYTDHFLVCIDCGTVMEENNFVNEFRQCSWIKTKKTFYGPVTRDAKGIFEVSILNAADEIYTSITKGRVHRANPRKALVFLSILKVYKNHELKITENELLEELMFTRAQIEKGFSKLKQYNYFPDEIDDLIKEFKDDLITSSHEMKI